VEAQEIGKGEGSGGSDNRKELRLGKMGRPEGAKAQEDRMVGKELRLLKTRGTKRRKPKEPKGGRGANPGSHRYTLAQASGVGRPKDVDK